MNWWNKIKNFQASWYHLLLIFFISFFIIVIRKTDLLTNPQFWAEDGAYWFAGAYNLGWQTIFLPHTGYFQTVSRLIASLSTLLPLVCGPLIFILTAITIKILPVIFLFSKRFSHIVQRFDAKVLIALLYLLLPNTIEVYANLTNSHWFLALLAFMIIISGVSSYLSWKIFNGFFLVLSGLSGPFVIFLFPIALIKWFVSGKNIKELINILFLAGCFVIQLVAVILTAFNNRIHTALGATVALFIKIVSGQIFIASLLGKNGYSRLYDNFLVKGDWLSWLIYSAVFLVGFYIIIYVLIKGKFELKLFLIFCFSIFLSSMISPMASLGQPQWQVLLLPGAGARYWFLPMLAFIIALVYFFYSSTRIWQRLLSILFFSVIIIGIRLDFFVPHFADLSYPLHIREFNISVLQSEVSIPINPTGWGMKLIKK